MNIDLNHVTRFSQLIAIVLFVGVFLLGFWLGMTYERRSLENALEAAMIEDVIQYQQAQAASSSPAAP